MKIKAFISKHKIDISIIILIITLTFFMMLFSVKDGDYFWHIKAGSYMVNNKVILTKDVFSWYLAGKPWFSHEWLFEIYLYLLSKILPTKHIFGYIFINLLIINIIIYIFNKKNYQKNMPFTIIWIGFSLLFCTTLAARPHMMSNILLALTIIISYDLFNNKDSRKIYFLPVIGCLWANIHGGSSIMAYLIPTLFSLCGLFTFSLAKIFSYRLTNRQIKKYIIAIILTILAICINPQGVKMLFYPFINMGNTLMIKTISEWQPTTLTVLGHYPYFILAILILGIFIFSKKKINLVDFVLFLFMLYLGLKSIRFWVYVYIASSFFVFNYVPAREKDRGVVGGLLLLSLFTFTLFLFNYKLCVKEKMVVSDRAIATIRKVKPKRLFNSYNYGGYLIYKNIKVFVDGRADLYSKYNYKDYLKIANLWGDYVKVIDKYNFDYLLVGKSYGIYTYLKYCQNYQLVYADKKVALYKKIDK